MCEDRIRVLEEKVDLLEFKIELLTENSGVDRLLIDYNISREEYGNLANLMDKYREKIDNNEKVSHMAFESEAIEIINNKGDYHFCEYLTKSMMEERKWEEVFPELYGSMNKYKHYMETRKGNE